MPAKKKRTDFPNWTAIRILAIMLLLGMAAGVASLGAVLLFSDDAILRLPPAAADISTKDLLYLRAYLRWNLPSLEAPSAVRDGIFEVQAGESATEICENLYTEGWISNADVLCAYLRYTGGDRAISAGLFLIRYGQNPRQIADTMVTGKDMVRTITVFPGWRIEEIAQSFSNSGTGISPSDIMAAMYQRPGAGGPLDALYADLPSHASLEGFALPGAYRVMPGETAPAVVQRMVQTFFESVPAEWRQAYATQGLSLYQAITIASIVQREAIVEDEMPIIASVYLNRTAIRMKLDADPTVQYALGFQPERGGWWTHPLWVEDFSLNSPYNTYLYTGLPPSPICNPGLAALKAVAFPSQTVYYFFRAACDGSGRHNFAETYLQQLANACSE